MLMQQLLFFFKAVTLHTDLGDIKMELCCELCPKSCEVGINILNYLPNNLFFYGIYQGGLANLHSVECQYFDV